MTAAELIRAWKEALRVSDVALASDVLCELMRLGYGVVDDAIRGPRVVKLVPCGVCNPRPQSGQDARR